MVSEIFSQPATCPPTHPRWFKSGWFADGLFVLVAILLTLALIEPPWTRLGSECLGVHSSASFGAFPDTVDSIANLVFQKWFHFSVTELGEWPLGHSRYLLFPYGGSHGAAFDGLLPAVLVGALSFLFPLPIAYNLAILSAFVFLAVACYRLGVFLWGRSVTAWVTGLSALMLPYVMQRAGQPNLMHVWTLPVGMLLYFRFAQCPTWGRAAAWMAAFPLMASASWYLLMAGMIFHGAASVEFVLFGVRELEKIGKRVARVLAVWVAGMGCVFLLAVPMLSARGGEGPVHDLATMARYSTPVIQYFLPYPHFGWMGDVSPFRYLQSQVGTLAEGYAGGPVASLVLFALFLCVGGRRAFIRERFLSGLTGIVAFVLSLGPYLQTVRSLPPGEGMCLPLYYLCRLWDGFTLIHAPGRLHVILALVALVGAGHLLHAIEERAWQKGRRAKGLFLAGVLVVFTLNGLWSCKPLSLSFFQLPPVPAFYTTLAAQAGPEAIFDVPSNSLFFGRYSYFQFTHKRPIVSSTVFHGAEEPLRRFLSEDDRNRFFWFEHSKDVETEEMARRISDVAYLDELGRRGIGFVIVHDTTLQTVSKFVPTLASPDLLRWYDLIRQGWSTRLLYEGEGIHVYSTHPLDPAPDGKAQSSPESKENTEP